MAREGFVDKHVGMTALRSCHPETVASGGRREALQGWLHPAKEKITKEEVQDFRK